MDGSKKILSLEDSIKLVNSFPSKNRNCKVSKGIISRKPNEGNASVTDDKPTRKGIHIYTDSKYRSKCSIGSNDSWFFNVTRDKTFLREHASIIKEIDGAKIIDYDRGKFSSKFGVDSIKYLSTGLKTVLNVLYFKRFNKKGLINISECGENCLDYIFEAVNNTNISLYLNHTLLYQPEGYKYFVNDKELVEDDCINYYV